MALKSTSMRFALLISAFFIIICLPALAATHGEFDRTLKVSGSVNLQVETGSGSIDVRTGNSSEVHVVGHIRATEWFGDNADEKIKRLESNPPMEQSAPGSVRAETGSGGLELRNVRGSLQAQAGSGNIKADGEATGGWTVHTGSGSVQLRLPQNASFDLNAHTGSGSINLSHPVTVQGSIGRKEVRGKVGGGGVPIEVQTGSGSIVIE